MIDILNYLLALSAVFFGYRIYVSRRNGRAFKEIRPLTVSFGITLLLLWGITVFTAFFFKNRLTYRHHGGHHRPDGRRSGRRQADQRRRCRLYRGKFHKRQQ
jgi:hypothetical protein